MNWLLEVHRDEKDVVVKTYRTAIECCNAIEKAYYYFNGLKESVSLIMKSEHGHLVTTVKTNEPDGG